MNEKQFEELKELLSGIWCELEAIKESVDKITEDRS